MTSTTEAEGSEDVNDFLLRIRELGEKRDKEDQERTRKLEEEILQGRKERQARRAERARSISPTKDSSPIIDSIRLSMPTLSQRAIDPPKQLEPTPHTPVKDTHTHSRSSSIWDGTLESTGGSRGSFKLEGDEIGGSPKASPSLRSRAGTLSWQQRPLSRDLSGNRSFFPASPTRESRRQMSTTASNDDTFKSSPPSKGSSPITKTDGNECSLEPKKSTEENSEDISTSDINSKELGLGVGSIIEPTKENVHQETAVERARSPSRASSTFADSSLGHRYSSVSSVSTATGLGSPIPLSNAQKFEPPKLDGFPDGQIPSPPSPRRLSPERSSSPTKGLGGFVQSAMMKRSDSISKRWSAQLPSGLSRGNSFASNRNSFAAPSSADVLSTSPMSRFSREGSGLSLHRPSSSHSEATVVHQSKAEERPATPPVSSSNDTTSGATKPSLALHVRSTSSVSVEKPMDSNSRPTTPPVSRTMDPKRWSPTKSTWLESALNRPDSPRHKRQPSEKSSWAKDRQSRTSVDMGRPSSFKEVTPIGLLRTADLQSHIKKPSISGIPGISSTQAQEIEKAPEETSTNPPAEKGSPILEIKSPDSLPPAVVEKNEIANETVTRKRAQTSLSPIPKTNIDIPLPSSHDPARNRPKPQSPVIDFRANLRRREVVKDQSVKEEPEFRNVFGKLKKTETSNYVAPDELKENILKGKAALQTTGGPKKSQRVDELKESILKQKDAMKPSGGLLRRSTDGESDVSTKAVPEAIEKRNKLAKSASIKSTISLDMLLSPSSEEPRGIQSPSHPQPTQPSSPLYEHDNEQFKESQDAHIASKAHSLDTHYAKETPNDCKPVDNGTTGRAEGASEGHQLNEVDTDEEQKRLREEPMEPVRPLPSGSVSQATKALTVTEGLVTKSNLAGRINPALAGLLSRGPSAPMDGLSKPSPEINPENPPSLTHMTKTRARGPKRRPPMPSKAMDSASKNESVSTVAQSPLFDIQTPDPNFLPAEYSPGSSSGWPLPNQEDGLNITLETGQSQPPSPVISNPIEFKRSIPRLAERDVSATSNPSTPSAKPRNLEKRFFEDIESREITPPSKPIFTPSQQATSPLSPLLSQARGSPIHYSSPSPSPLRTSFKENQSHMPPRPAATGATFFGSRDSSPFRKSLPSPPVPPKGPGSTSTDQLSSPRSSASLVPQADESLEAISGFFTTFPNSSDRVNIDPQLILMAKSENPKIRTLRKQIWEITGDGKRQDLPINQEYILYEGAMYLCVHIFEMDGSTRSEVHLWCGDDVWDGAVDDAQAFSRRVAREHGCKLEVIKQGKEPARFIQALGGILITRRGSSSRSSSSAIFMLCGRKHLGQMVFDEVEFAPHNLCTGYPFVISAMFGKVYLWKGKGSSAEEIGAARLIGMDLGLTGEFEEVTEGEEPKSFFEVFPLHKEEFRDYMHSTHWLLKPAHDHFRLRLLRVDHELGQRSFWIRRPGSSSPVIRPNDTVQEVEPFCQKDLSPKGIYVLDIFFEIYVIVGEQASHRPAEFASAVVFAHEYGILAASLQDRPFIPRSFISLGGVPNSCHSAFRKWVQNPSRRPPQVFPLNAAIEAIRS